MAMAAHVARAEESKALIERVMKEFGRLDILMNNAGTSPYNGPMMDESEKTWDITMNVNVKGVFLLSQLAARVMKEQGGGSIINTASIAGLRAGVLGTYSVSKAAVIMLTKVMAKEWGQYNIRVNAIAPGVIKTRFSEVYWKNPEAGAQVEQNMPLMRLGETEEITGTVLLLASDAGSYITGETIVIDGGRIHGEPSFLEKR